MQRLCCAGTVAGGNFAMRALSRFASWPPIVKALTVIWLSWLAAGRGVDLRIGLA